MSRFEAAKTSSSVTCHGSRLAKVFALFFLPCLLGQAAFGQNLVSKDWQGSYPVAELDRFDPGRESNGIGYIVDQTTWTEVWTAFSDEPTPVVNFNDSLVVYARNVEFLNIISPLSVTLDQGGAADVVAASTRTARPIEDFVYWSAGVIPNNDVQFLQQGSTQLQVVAPEPTSLFLATLCGGIWLSCGYWKHRKYASSEN